MSSEEHTFASSKDDLKLLEEKSAASTGKGLLQKTRVSDALVHKHLTIINVKSSDSVLQAFHLLGENRILSLPVFNVRKKKHNAFIDMMDILHHVLDPAGSGQVAPEALEKELKSTTVGDVAGLSRQNTYYEIETNSPLMAVIEIITKHHLQRLAVVDYSEGSQDNLTSIVTQSQVVSFIHDHIAMFPEAQQTVKDSFTLSPPPFVADNVSAVEAFQLMREKKLGALGVMSGKKIIDIISVSDLRILGGKTQQISLLYTPVSDFLSYKKQHSAGLKKEAIVSVTPTDTIEKLVSKVVVHKVHRIYVSEGETTVGLITLEDILRFFKNK